MATVNQILSAKGNAVWTVAPDSTVYEALQLMADKDVGAVLVVEGKELRGIFSERDYARKIILLDKASKSTPISDVMTRNVFYVHPEQTVEECMALMTDKRIRHLPVLNAADELTGIISIGDVVKTIISDQKVIIDHLKGYITGNIA